MKKQLVKSLAACIMFLIFASPVQAEKITITYTISSPLFKTITGNSSASTPKEKEQVAGSVKSKLSILICEVFGKDCPTALAIAKAESGLRCNAINWGDAQITGMPSQGLFQLNRVYDEINFDCEYNVKEAYKMFVRRGFSPWSAYLNKSYLKFL